MTSRKRNKGRDRKAKKAEVEAERIERVRELVRHKWHAWACGLDDKRRVITQCNHGGALIIPDDKNHPVACFLDTFFFNAIHNISGLYNLNDTFQRLTEVWTNESYRSMAIRILVHCGTNSLHCQDTSMLRDITHAIVIFENYDGGAANSFLCNRVVASKMRDIHLGGSCQTLPSKRDLLKFYRKRIACSCLKGMHLEARKTLPKLGKCYHCKLVKERAMLMVCGTCGVAQYCSRKCQMAHWPSHKCDCDIYDCVPEQQEKAMNKAYLTDII